MPLLKVFDYRGQVLVLSLQSLEEFTLQSGDFLHLVAKQLLGCQLLSLKLVFERLDATLQKFVRCLQL